MRRLTWSLTLAEVDFFFSFDLFIPQFICVYIQVHVLKFVLHVHVDVALNWTWNLCLYSWMQIHWISVKCMTYEVVCDFSSFIVCQKSVSIAYHRCHTLPNINILQSEKKISQQQFTSITWTSFFFMTMEMRIHASYNNYFTADKFHVILSALLTVN